MLMCEVSKNIKETLQSTVGCANAVSFHALVCAQQTADSAAIQQQVPSNSLLQTTHGDLVCSGGGGEMSTFKAATTTSIAAIQRMSLPNRLSTMSK